MSQTQRGVPAALREDEPTRLTDGDDLQAVLQAFEDPDCRAIMEAARDEWLTVEEIEASCDLPSSTAYRKVNALVEADLLEESLRIRDSGAHVSTYACAVDDVTLTVGDQGVELTLEGTQQDDGESLAVPACD